MAFAALLNLVSFACVANSNPGYVEEAREGQMVELAPAVGGRQDVESGGGGHSRSDPGENGAEAGGAKGDHRGEGVGERGEEQRRVGEIEEDGEDGDTGGGLLGLPRGATSSSGGGFGVESDREEDEDLDATPTGQTCKHCNAWQGLRTKHCHDCGRCVRKFDHHCFWVGTCVGEKNHARFVWYLTTQVALILWAFHIANTGIRYRPTMKEIFDDNAGPVMMCFALFLFTLFVGSLWGFHAFLMFTAQTTWEVSSRDKITYLRGVPKNVYPFSKGPVQDVADFCCLPAPPDGYTMTSLRELREWSKKETIWENRYYVCC